MQPTHRSKVRVMQETPDIALSVKDLKTYFYTNNRCNKAINGVSFDIRKGKTLCVVGESGCGKESGSRDALYRYTRIPGHFLGSYSSGVCVHADGGRRGSDQLNVWCLLWL